MLFRSMTLFGATKSPEAVFMIPVGILTGLAFAAPIAAYAVTLERDGPLTAIFRFGVMPMFLFSGTFFPVSRLPLPLEWLAYATPLWHGVDLCRELTLGNVHLLRALGHVGYLSLFVIGGLLWGERTYRKRLFT